MSSLTRARTPSESAHRWGEVVSRLARQGILAQDQVRTTLVKPKSRYALLPARGEMITPEHVRSLLDQEGM